MPAHADKPGYRAMLEEIALMPREMRAVAGIAEFSPRVLAALGSIPRHRFVPPGEECFASDNRVLSIGHEQTSFQPYIVARMTELLHVDKRDTVLEAGTDSSHQTAVLEELAGQVYSIEIVEPLAHAAAARLLKLGYANMQVCAGDGYAGWPEYAPFGAIIVIAAATHIPHPLVEQLKLGGRMAIPIGQPFSTQELMLVKKDEGGRVHSRCLLPVGLVS